LSCRHIRQRTRSPARSAATWPSRQNALKVPAST
jgi:hypothetical protein